MQSVVDPLAPAGQVAENGHPVFVIRADLSDDHDLERVVELTLSRFDRIDLLVNAAGYSFWAPIVESNRLLDSANAQFTVNTIVPLKLSTLIARTCWRDRSVENSKNNRNVVNVSSTAGIYVYPGTYQNVYSASKAALNFLTCHMAEEFRAFGVRVNAIAPDAFPSRVSTEVVAKAIRRFDHAQSSGQILVLDKDGEWEYSLSPWETSVETEIS